jgi:hypothetical protein
VYFVYYMLYYCRYFKLYLFHICDDFKVNIDKYFDAEGVALIVQFATLLMELRSDLGS